MNLYFPYVGNPRLNKKTYYEKFPYDITMVSKLCITYLCYLGFWTIKRQKTKEHQNKMTLQCISKNMQHWEKMFEHT